MASLQDLLSSTQPDELQKILDSVKSPTVEQTEDPMVDNGNPSPSGKLDFNSNFDPKLQQLLDTYKNLPAQAEPKPEEPETLDDNGMGGVPASQVFHFHAPVNAGPVSSPQEPYGPPASLASPQVEPMLPESKGTAPASIPSTSTPKSSNTMPPMPMGAPGFTNDTVEDRKSVV